MLRISSIFGGSFFEDYIYIYILIKILLYDRTIDHFDISKVVVSLSIYYFLFINIFNYSIFSILLTFIRGFIYKNDIYIIYIFLFIAASHR